MVVVGVDRDREDDTAAISIVGFHEAYDWPSS